MADIELDEDTDLFCPDLPIGEEDADQRLLAVQSAIHDTGAPGFQTLALDFWLQAREQLVPVSIKKALAKWMRRACNTGRLSQRLTGDPNWLDPVLRSLADLPARALGAWCYGDPVYPRPPEGFTEQELYAEPGGLLSADLWRALDGSELWNCVEQLEIYFPTIGNCASALRNKEDWYQTWLRTGMLQFAYQLLYAEMYQIRPLDMEMSLRKKLKSPEADDSQLIQPYCQALAQGSPELLAEIGKLLLYNYLFNKKMIADPDQGEYIIMQAPSTDR